MEINNWISWIFERSNSLIKIAPFLLHKLILENYDSSFSCSKIQTFCWFKKQTLNYEFKNVVKTQDIEPVFW